MTLRWKESIITGLLGSLALFGYAYEFYVQPQIKDSLKPVYSYCRSLPNNTEIKTLLGRNSCEQIKKLYQKG